MTDITAKPFDWNDYLSKEALEDFEGIRKDLPYCTCQSIGMALAKLELLEEQGQELRIGHWIDDEFGSRCSFCNQYTHLDKFDRPIKSMCCSICGAKMFEPQEGGDQE